MSKITVLKVNNFLGIDEFGLEAAKVNIFSGPMGSGKSSILEAIEKTFTNRSRRTEVIKHGADEATLFLSLDDGLEVERRIRESKGDYFKVRKGEEGVPSTEKFLRSLVNGEIFKPVEWINMGVKEQTKSILNMLQIEWSMEDIVSWFGEETCNINYEQHILQVLKAIELKYFKDREEINRQIKELKAQIGVILKEIPADYDGEEWRNKKVQEHYNKVAEAQKINTWIAEARRVKESIQEKISTIEATAENEKSKIKLKFKDQAQDIKDIIELSKNKIEKSKEILNGLDTAYQFGLKAIDTDNKEAKSDLEIELQNKIQELKDEYAERIATVDRKSNLDKENSKTMMEHRRENEKDLINIQENKISSKNQELLSLDEIENQEIINIENKKTAEIEKVKEKVGKAAEYLEKNEEIDVTPLQIEADEVADMQSYLRQWDMMLDIRDIKLAEKCRYSALLTERVEKARVLPSELLQVAKMPIEGISVDEKGLIRINNTLIDGLSDGEKLSLAMKIAREQCGELKVICIDKFESLNPAAQAKLLEEMESDDFQYFITSTMSDEFKIEKIGSLTKVESKVIPIYDMELEEIAF